MPVKLYGRSHPGPKTLQRFALVSSNVPLVLDVHSRASGGTMSAMSAESLHLTPPPWTSARLPGARSHNKGKVFPPRATHQANPYPPPPLPSYLACHLHTFLASSCRRTTNAIIGALLSFCHADFQLLITPLVLPWLDTGRLSNS